MSAVIEIDPVPGGLAFSLRPTAGGGWRVRGPGDRCGGLFATREAALSFIRRERRVLEATIRLPPARAGAPARLRRR